MAIKNIVILAGGRGSRLGKITQNTPKPLLKIGNKPFLDQLICKILKYNFNKIFILTSYKKNLFFKKYHNKIIHNSKLICLNEGKPKGTGGALYRLKNKIKNNFILVNGDTFFDIDYNYLINKKLNKNSVFMCLTSKKKTINNTKLNNLDVYKNKINFKTNSSKFNNGGIYIVNFKLLRKIKNRSCSFENDILNKEIISNRVIGKYFDDFFIDIGSTQQLKFIKKNPSYLMNKCVFLDRDGVINKELGYITDIKKFKLNNGVSKAIKYINKLNYLNIIITNQAAVGKGLLSEKKLNSIHFYMKKIIKKKNNSIIDDIYYCPYFKHSKINKFKKNSFDRKPNTGMFLKAIKKWNINLKKSLYIGDQITDMQVAKKLSLKFYYKKNISLYNQILPLIK